MMEEEGAVIAGLLVGLNVIDANLCMKGEDLDSQVLLFPLSLQQCWLLCLLLISRLPSDSCDQVGVIDFSMYLKDGGHTSKSAEG